MTSGNSQEGTCGATSRTQRRMGRGKQALDQLRLSTPVLCLCAATFLVGLVGGLSHGIRIPRIALICGFVAALVVISVLSAWLESRARTVVEERERAAAPGLTNAVVILPHFIDRHMN